VLRSLHMKLMLIMVLLIISLMTVVGAFLMNSAVRFFIDEFYTQINEVTSRVEFTDDLTHATEGENNPVAMIDQMLDAYVGELGVDGRNRNYYILDGQTAAFLAEKMPHGYIESGFKKMISVIDKQFLGENADELIKSGLLRDTSVRTIEFVKAEMIR